MDAADRWWLGLSDKTRFNYYRWLDKSKKKAPKKKRPSRPPRTQLNSQPTLFEELPPPPEQEP